jgi:hypothetical protein
VPECDHLKINSLDTYCEKEGRRGKDYEMKKIKEDKTAGACVTHGKQCKCIQGFDGET